MSSPKRVVERSASWFRARCWRGRSGVFSDVQWTSLPMSGCAMSGAPRCEHGTASLFEAAQRSGGLFFRPFLLAAVALARPCARDIRASCTAQKKWTPGPQGRSARAFLYNVREADTTTHDAFPESARRRNPRAVEARTDDCGRGVESAADAAWSSDSRCLVYRSPLSWLCVYRGDGLK